MGHNQPETASFLQQYEGFSHHTFSFSFFLFLSSTADFEANYGMGFGWHLQDYTKYTQAIHTVHQDPTQAQLLSAANEGRVDEVVGLLEGVELSELDEVVSRESMYRVCVYVWLMLILFV